jgi:hypothetical protein
MSLEHVRCAAPICVAAFDHHLQTVLSYGLGIQIGRRFAETPVRTTTRSREERRRALLPTAGAQNGETHGHHQVAVRVKSSLISRAISS